ncbi:MAG: class I SAM-dependent methyltransferase [Actinomycetota bacterium]|nr:class I SAM-dependent methyltransferase [Actinomycetota bacterium]
MNRIAASARYARDIGEVLFLNRLTGSPLQRFTAGDAATIVRRTRFHAHARIQNQDLRDIVGVLGTGGVAQVTLPGPKDLSGVGNATYYHALASIARAVNPSSVLEIGTYLGIGTLTLALNTSAECRITTVDLPDDAIIEEAHDLSSGDIELIRRRRTRVGEAFESTDEASRIRQIRTDSLTWQPDASLKPVDLVLIDGGHSYPLVKADTENAFELLSPTGTILWDDYFYLYPGVVGYLESLVDEGRRLHVIRGTNLVIYDQRLQ